MVIKTVTMLMLFESFQFNVQQLRRNYALVHLAKILLPLIYNFNIIAAIELIFEINDTASLDERLHLKIIFYKSLCES